MTVEQVSVSSEELEKEPVLAVILKGYNKPRLNENVSNILHYVLKMKSRCPKCEQEGKDRHGDNLHTYPDGHEHCFSCGYYKAAKITTVISNHVSRPIATSIAGPLLLSPTCTTDLPAVALEWLRSYHITDKEIHDYKLCYDPTRDLLIHPLFSGETMVCYSGRYFGQNPDHPKYITTGYRTDSYTLFTSGKAPSLLHRTTNLSRRSPIIFVEDFISAIKVARQFSCIPLLSSHFPTRLIISLLAITDCIRIWLDFDKAKDAMKLSNKAGQWLPNCGTIITERDPKDYSDEEINAFVLRSLEGILNVPDVC